jgi:hypothetical protein
MLVKFSSTKTEPLIMTGDVAVRLIKMMGATGAIPGGIKAEDISAAVTQLQQQLSNSALETNKQRIQARSEEEREREPSLSLATRAAPLIEILQRAQRAGATVMWEQMK